MKPKQPKYKPRRSQAEKDYFKSIADQVREARMKREATTKPDLNRTGSQGDTYHAYKEI